MPRHEAADSRLARSRSLTPLSGRLAAQRITIRHTKQQRKIVGNAAPMSKNLQEYLDKHKDCEVYKGQDHPDEPKQVNPMEVRRTHPAPRSAAR